MKRLLCFSVFGAIAFVSSLTEVAHATIIVSSYYRLGEADLGAVAAGAGNATTTDSAGANNLTKNGTPVYSASVGTTAATATGSTLSMSFAGNGGYSGPPANTAANNYGIEGWFNLASTTGVQEIFGNGNASTTGYGFYTNGGVLHVIYGGQGDINTGLSISANTWNYVALVSSTSANNVTLYLNGTAPANTNVIFGTSIPVGAPFTPNNFHIGAGAGGNVNMMTGLVDEVRAFTFTAGQFSTTDLLINQVPEPSTFAMLLFGSVSMWLMRRPRTR